LAVLAVLVCHQGLSSSGYYSGGALGVDVFFVLSGFLITSLLLIDHARTGRVLSMGFWARRARRLFPAMLVFIAILAVYAAFVARSTELGALRRGALATLLYVRNYWGISNTSPTSGHVWSLSVEEQFYIAWPVLLALLVWFTRRTKWLVVIVLALAFASAAMMGVRYADTHSTRYVYAATETRAQDLLIGAALGIVLFGRRVKGLVLEIAGFAALAFLVLSTIKVSDFRPQLYQGGFLVVSFATAILITASVAEGKSRLRTLLSWRPLVWIGLISYGLYLYHVPLYSFIDRQEVVTSEAARFVLRFALVGLVAVASYFLVERPIRRGALSRPSVRILALVAAASVVLAVIVATNGATTVQRELLPLDIRLQALVFQKEKDAAHGDQRVLVAGDTLASSLVSLDRPQYEGDGIRGVVEWASKCDPMGGSVALTDTPAPTPPPRCSPTISYLTAVASYEPDVSVIVLGPSVVFDRFANGQRVEVGTPLFDGYLFSRLDTMRSLLVRDGTRLMITTVPCMTPPTRGQYAGLAAIQRDKKRVAAVNDALRRYAATRDVAIADLGKLICSHPEYLDGNGTGLSTEGRTAAWQLLAADAGPPSR
jgi:peptidoglycan/LPS O-acetylase OafA/YrhL